MEPYKSSRAGLKRACLLPLARDWTHNPSSRKKRNHATFPPILEMDTYIPSTDKSDLDKTDCTGVHIIDESSDPYCRDSWVDLRLISEGGWLNYAIHANSPLEGNDKCGWCLIYSPQLQSSPSFDYKSNRKHPYDRLAAAGTNLDSSSPSASASTLWSSNTSVSAFSIRKKHCISNLRSRYSFTMSPSASLSGNPDPVPHSPGCSAISRCVSPRAEELVQLLDHFSSFCVLDAKSPSNAVIAASKDIYSAGGRGEQFPLNIKVLEEESCPVVSGFDDHGNNVSYLIIATKLYTAKSGKFQLFLATLLDITDFLHAVTLEDLELRRYPGTLDNGRGGLSSIPSRLNLDAADITDTSLKAMDENKGTEIRPSQSPTSMSPSQTIEQLLSEFSAELLYLYKDTFILARSPQDNTLYKISHVSRSLYAEGEYIHSHLKHTPADKMQLLSEHLGKDCRFDLVVNWGDSGVEKRLYCAPIYYSSSWDWVCTMTDIDVPYLWHRKKS
ncbi:hypothetical protein MauCBS54593_001157 [Microsporum audouinii]